MNTTKATTRIKMLETAESLESLPFQSHNSTFQLTEFTNSFQIKISTQQH